jgi:hypothetical protein
LIGSAALMLRLSRDFGKQEKFRCAAMWEQSVLSLRHCEQSEEIHVSTRDKWIASLRTH